MRTLALAAGILAAAALALSGCGGAHDSSTNPGGNPAGGALLSITSTPAGARVAIDGMDTGKVTPADIATASNLDLGAEHVVTLTLAGYNTWSGTATVSDQDTFTVRATLTSTSAAPGTLRAQSEPAGARVYIDGADTGKTTPATIDNVSASQHVVEYHTDSGYYPYREEVTIQPGVASVSAPILTRIGYGRITGRVVDPDGNGLVGATVAVRGVDATAHTTNYGIYVLPNVPAGTYSLTGSITVGANTFVGTRDGVLVTDGKMTANTDVITAIGGASGSITGRVTDMAGNPVGGAELFASQAVAPNFTPDPTLAPYHAEADSSGAYTLTSLPTGFWVVTAMFPQYATVTNGINSQIYVASGATVRSDFALPAASAPRPSAPLQLSATAFTMPQGDSRAPSAYQAIRNRLIAKTRAARWPGSRWQLPPAAAQSRSRTAPPGSLIEVDLSWVAPNSADIVGYFIGRSDQSDVGYSVIEDLLNPTAGLWIDYDQRLTPGRPAFYRVTAVNSQGLNSDPSNTAQALPLDQVTAASPVDSQAPAVPTFTWNQLPGGFVYSVSVFGDYPNQAAVSVWDSPSVYPPNASVQYAGPPLQSGHTYYWVVIAGNTADLNSVNGWSISRLNTFTVQ